MFMFAKNSFFPSLLSLTLAPALMWEGSHSNCPWSFFSLCGSCMVETSTSAPQRCSSVNSYLRFGVEVACARVHLVGVVGADVAECRWGRLAEQRWGVALETIHADVFRMRDIGEQWWEGGRRADSGWGGGREVGQTLCEAVHVDLDLWVVKVFLSIAVVRVTVPAVRDKEFGLLHLQLILEYLNIKALFFVI